MERIELNAKISARIITLMQNGMSLKEAFNKALGVAAYECLALELYDELVGA